ncbi:MAG: flippase [archaeon]|nr:MAG: flippase [archaeon]
MAYDLEKHKRDLLKQKVVKNSVYNSFAILVSKFGGFIFTIIVARLLFPELFGIYTLALALILTLATITELGINTTIIRFIADSLGKKNGKQEARSRLKFLFTIRILFTFAISILLFIFSKQIAIGVFSKPLLQLPLQIGAIYLIVNSIQQVILSIFVALQKIKHVVTSEIIFQVSRIALIFIFLYFFKSVSSVFITLSIAIGLTILVMYLILAKEDKYLLKGKTLPVERRRLLSFFSWMTLSAISLMILTRIDTFILGAFLKSQFIGYYGAIFTIISTAALAITFSGVLLPVFTQLQGRNLKTLFQKTFHYICLFSIPLALGLAIMIPWIIRVIFGAVYVPTAYTTQLTITAALLAFIVIETPITNFFAMVFTAKEKTKTPALLAFFSLVLIIVLSFLIIPPFIRISPQHGLIGAALAVVIGRVFYLIILAVLTKTNLKLLSKPMSIIKPVIASIIMVFVLLCFVNFTSLNLFWGIISIIVAIAVYFLVMVLIKGATVDDLKLIKLIR